MLKTTKWRGLPYIVLLGLTCAFSLTTHFSPVANENFGHDAGIFAYIGMALTLLANSLSGAYHMHYFISHLTDRQEWENLIGNNYCEEENDFCYRIYKRNS